MLDKQQPFLLGHLRSLPRDTWVVQMFLKDPQRVFFPYQSSLDLQSLSSLWRGLQFRAVQYQVTTIGIEDHLLLKLFLWVKIEGSESLNPWLCQDIVALMSVFQNCWVVEGIRIHCMILMFTSHNCYVAKWASGGCHNCGRSNILDFYRVRLYFCVCVHTRVCVCACVCVCVCACACMCAKANKIMPRK